MKNHNPTRRTSPFLRFSVLVAVALLFSILTFRLLMQPSLSEIGLLALFLAITSGLSLIAGYSAYRLGWMVRSPRLLWTLLGMYTLSNLLALLTVWLTARLMFVNQHDLLLATVLLIFAAAIGMTLGYFFSTTLTQRITALNHAAREIMQGHLKVRLPVQGRDEVTELASAFNQMAAQLEEAAQMRIKMDGLRRDLIAWIGHDLQTPLTSIRAIIEALADGVIEDQTTTDRYFRTAQREIQNLSHLIDDLSQMSQLDTGRMPLNIYPNSISDLISDTIESFSELASRKGITIEGSSEVDIDPVDMDAQRIGRVLANLVSNAIRHTSSGGEVRLQAVRVSGGIQVEVQDSGEGIPLEDLSFIFDSFYRGEKSRNREKGGPGLGLAIARGIIQAHAGTITAENIPSGGSRFTFFLPQQPTISSLNGNR
jgi:signal transduction histidine kinase